MQSIAEGTPCEAVRQRAGMGTLSGAACCPSLASDS